MAHAHRTALRLLALVLLAGLGVGAAIAVHRMYTEPVRDDGGGAGSASTGDAQSSAGATGGEGRETDSGGGQNGKGTGTQSADANMDGAVRMKAFETEVYGDREKPEAIIRGKEALKKNSTYQIIAPLLLSYLGQSGQGEEVDLELSKVELRAERATWLEGEGNVHLYEHVKAEGKEFDISTQDVTFNISEHTLTSDSAITLRKYRTDSSGRKSLAMRVTGDGLSVDLTMKKVVIEKDPVARLYDMSEDFLAGDGPETSDRELSDAVVTAEGSLTYEHPAHQVTFSGGVKAVFGEKELRCEKLVLAVGENEKNGTMDITEIAAHDKVRFEYGSEVATGDKLVWKTVTQNCVLTGRNATVRTAEFRLTGEKLSFFRLNSRFQAEGPGSLHWVPPRSLREIPSGQQDQGSETDSIAEVPAFQKNAPVRISWKNAMTYDKTEHRALFDGDILVTQGQTQLAGESLKIDFAPEGGRIMEVSAEQNVRLTQEMEEGERTFACHRVVWQAGDRTVTLKAADKEQVRITGTGQQLSAPEITFHGNSGKISCPAGGTMKIGAGPAEGGLEPSSRIALAWQKSMEFDRGAAPVAVFKGSVQARRGTHQISGDTLTVNFSADMKPVRIRVSGNGLMKATAAEEAGGRAADYRTGGAAKEYSASVKALSGGLAGMGGGNSSWQLSCPEFLIELPKNSIRATQGGSIEISRAEGAEDRIRWSSRMKVSGQEKFAYFEGEVEAHMSGAALQSDTLRVGFDNSGELRHIKAEGNVAFSARSGESWHMQCSSCEAIFVGPSSLRQIVARDNVHVTGKDIEVDADQLQLFFTEVGPRKELVRTRVIARNNVVVRQKGSEKLQATGDLLRWSRDENQYVLTGEPRAVVSRDGVKLQNETIILDGETLEMSAPSGGTPVQTEVRTGEETIP